jgi:hypothetical protein
MQASIVVDQVWLPIIKGIFTKGQLGCISIGYLVKGHDFYPVPGLERQALLCGP